MSMRYFTKNIISLKIIILSSVFITFIPSLPINSHELCRKRYLKTKKISNQWSLERFNEIFTLQCNESGLCNVFFSFPSPLSPRICEDSRQRVFGRSDLWGTCRSHDQRIRSNRYLLLAKKRDEKRCQHFGERQGQKCESCFILSWKGWNKFETTEHEEVM